MAKILLNGKPFTVTPGITVSALLSEKEINPAHVVVEVNRTIVQKNRFSSTALNEDDVIEILRFVGGG